MNIQLEICTGSLSSAINARLGGAHRIELCDNLSEGGTTPSPGIIRQAKPMQVTFHRAFDMTCDPLRAMEEIIRLGIDRILTSGQATTAWDGVPLISQLIRQAGGRIIILPGGGIDENNVIDLIQKTGANEIHASLRSPVKSGMKIMNNMLSVGMNAGDGDSWFETSPEKVRHMMNLFKENQF